MKRLIRYVWAFPTTLIGLVLLPLVFVGRGRVAVVGGVIEAHGRWISWLLRHLIPIPGGALAITLGHVILGRDADALDRTREHEHIHVRQAERWGPFFLPAYLFSSLAELFVGGNPYRSNIFEREAYAATAIKKPDRSSATTPGRVES